MVVRSMIEFPIRADGLWESVWTTAIGPTRTGWLSVWVKNYVCFNKEGRSSMETVCRQKTTLSLTRSDFGIDQSPALQEPFRDVASIFVALAPMLQLE